MNASSSRPQSDSAEPLRHDIRLLGRLLGTVIAECEGKRVFDTIETLRRTAVKFRREGNDADGKLLQERVKRLQGSDPNSVARAFSYFLHLSNIAEDRDQNRRQRARALPTRRRRAAACARPCRRWAATASARPASAACWPRPA